MPFRKCASNPDDANFREALLLWAREFVGSEAAAKRVAQRTIDVLCDNPSLLDGRDINEAIFMLLRRNVFDEIELALGQDSQGDSALSEKQPTC